MPQWAFVWLVCRTLLYAFVMLGVVAKSDKIKERTHKDVVLSVPMAIFSYVIIEMLTVIAFVVAFRRHREKGRSNT